MLFPFWELDFILINMPNKLVSPNIVFIPSDNLQRGEEAAEFPPVVGIPVRGCCWVGVCVGSGWPPVHFFQNPPGHLSHGLRQSAGEGFQFWLWTGTTVEIKEGLGFMWQTCASPVQHSPAESLFSLVSFLFWARHNWESSWFRSWCTPCCADKGRPSTFRGRGAPS